MNMEKKNKKTVKKAQVVTPFTYDHTKQLREVTELPSETIQRDNLTVKELLNMAVNGMSSPSMVEFIDQDQSDVDHDQLDLEEVNRMDIAEQEELLDEAQIIHAEWEETKRKKGVDKPVKKEEKSTEKEDTEQDEK